MRRADLLAGLFLGLVGLLMLVFVIPAQIEDAGPGFVSPRLVPNITMIVVVGLSAVLILKALRGHGYDGTAGAALFTRGELIMILRLSLVFILAIGLFWWVSPLAAAIGLVVGALLALGERRPLVLVAMPAILITAVWLLFYRVLGTAIV